MRLVVSILIGITEDWIIRNMYNNNNNETVLKKRRLDSSEHILQKVMYVARLL